MAIETTQLDLHFGNVYFQWCFTPNIKMAAPAEFLTNLKKIDFDVSAYKTLIWEDQNLKTHPGNAYPYIQPSTYNNLIWGGPLKNLETQLSTSYLDIRAQYTFYKNNFYKNIEPEKP